jgi:hypothetical protein
MPIFFLHLYSRGNNLKRVTSIKSINSMRIRSNFPTSSVIVHPDGTFNNTTKTCCTDKQDVDVDVKTEFIIV